MKQTEELIERKFLCGERVRTKKELKMADIYKDFDEGLSWEEVCIKHGVSESTIRRRHKEYQAMVKEESKKIKTGGDELPPLPHDM